MTLNSILEESLQPDLLSLSAAASITQPQLTQRWLSWIPALNAQPKALGDSWLWLQTGAQQPSYGF